MFVEFHARSAFSFLEGASSPEELVARCADMDMPAMALLDRDGVYSSPRFHMAARHAGIRAHIGAEITATGGLRYPLLAETRTGYQNLCRMITRMKLRSRKGEGEVDLPAFFGPVITGEQRQLKFAVRLRVLPGQREPAVPASALRHPSQP